MPPSGPLSSKDTGAVGEGWNCPTGMGENSEEKGRRRPPPRCSMRSFTLAEIISSAAFNSSSGPVIRQTCGPPGAFACSTEMFTWLPAFCRMSLMVAPPGPMSPPTRS